MPSEEPTRTVRRLLVGAVLVAGSVLAFFAGPRIWFLISTRPEPAFEGTPANRGPFAFIPELAGDVRVLRFGDHAEFRHGPFFAERRGRTITGAYDRGTMAGRWSVRQGEELLLEGYGIEFLRESKETVRGIVFGVEVEFQHHEDWQWRVLPLDFWIEGEGELFGAMCGPDGGFAIGAIDLADVDEYWLASETRVEFDSKGARKRLVSDGLVTEYAEEGNIIRQHWIAPGGEVIGSRNGPPWWDPLTGDFAGGVFEELSK